MKLEFAEIWADLPSEIRWLFESHATMIELKRGDTVYRQDDVPRGIYFVKSGLVGLTKSGVSGKEHLLRFFKAGQFFGHRALFSEENYHASAVVLGPTTLKLVPKATILSALEKEPRLYSEIVSVLARELRRCENQHVMILDNQITTRVAQGLLFLKDLHPDHNWTRQEIANFCASTVSTVIKSLAELESMGLIEQTGRSIQIKEREKLIALQDDEG